MSWRCSRCFPMPTTSRCRRPTSATTNRAAATAARISRGLHALVAARLGDVALAERYFHETAAIDLADTASGSAGGVHIAALGGLWQAAIFGFAGLSLHGDGCGFAPHLPAAWRALEFRLFWRGSRVHVRLNGSARRLNATLEHGEPLTIRVGDERGKLELGRPLQLTWQDATDAGQLGAPTSTAEAPPDSLPV